MGGPKFGKTLLRVFCLKRGDTPLCPPLKLGVKGVAIQARLKGSIKCNFFKTDYKHFIFLFVFYHFGIWLDGSEDIF